MIYPKMEDRHGISKWQQFLINLSDPFETAMKVMDYLLRKMYIWIFTLIFTYNSWGSQTILKSIHRFKVKTL